MFPGTPYCLFLLKREGMLSLSMYLIKSNSVIHAHNLLFVWTYVTLSASNDYKCRLM